MDDVGTQVGAKGKSALWLEAGSTADERADLEELLFLGCELPARTVVGVDFAASGRDRTGELTVFQCGRQRSFLPPTFKPGATAAGLLDLGTDDPEVVQRAADLKLLRALTDETEELRANESEAFDAMLERLDDPNRRYETLTAKQRRWAIDVAEREELDWEDVDPAEKNANVPRGCEVQMAFDVDKRPLAPPGRKQSVELTISTGHPDLVHTIPVESIDFEESPRARSFEVFAAPDIVQAGSRGLSPEDAMRRYRPESAQVEDAAREMLADLPEGPAKERAKERLAARLTALVAASEPRKHEAAPDLPPIFETAAPGPGERARRPVRRPRG